MKLIHAQFQMFLARAALATATVHSGAYKLSRARRGCGRNPDGTVEFRDQTDEEKLAEAIAQAQRHLQFAQECMDHESFAESDCEGCRDGLPTRQCSVTGETQHRGKDFTFQCRTADQGKG